MKMNFRPVLAGLLMIALLTSPASQAAAAEASPKNTKKKSASKKEAAAKPKYNPVPAVVKQDRVNVRGQASQFSEVVTQLRKGEAVTILEEVTLAKPKTGEPAVWARIALPPNTPVWVHAPLIDAASKTVTANKINVRAGPGENFSVLGQLDKGSTVVEIRRVDEWMEIEAPKSVTAFVALDLLSKTEMVAQVPAPAEPAKPITPEPAPLEPLKPEPVKPEPVIAAPSAPVAPAAPAPAPPAPLAPAPVVVPAPEAKPKAPAVAQPAIEVPKEKTPFKPALSPREQAKLPVKPAINPPLFSSKKVAAQPAEPPRIVFREGVVRPTVSIQAPTPYALVSEENNKLINYLYSSSAAVKFSDLDGLRILVSGEELIDERWPKTPVIKIKTLRVVE